MTRIWNSRRTASWSFAVLVVLAGLGTAKSIDDIQFPPLRKTDFDVFGNVLLM